MATTDRVAEILQQVADFIGKTLFQHADIVKIGIMDQVYDGFVTSKHILAYSRESAVRTYHELACQSAVARGDDYDTDARLLLLPWADREEMAKWLTLFCPRELQSLRDEIGDNMLAGYIHDVRLVVVPGEPMEIDTRFLHYFDMWYDAVIKNIGYTVRDVYQDAGMAVDGNRPERFLKERPGLRFFNPLELRFPDQTPPAGSSIPA